MLIAWASVHKLPGSAGVLDLLRCAGRMNFQILLQVFLDQQIQPLASFKWDALWGGDQGS
jgi:hypothetical protein